MRVAVVEDHEITVERLIEVIGQTAGLQAAGWWHRLDAAYDTWTLEVPDVAIISRRLLGRDPVAALDAINATLDLPIVIRACNPHVEFVQIMLTAGARGVVEETSSSTQTLDAILTVADGETAIPADMRDELHIRLARGIQVPYMTLSRRERQIATLAAGGATAQEVADRLCLALPTVRTHLKRAYGKLQVKGHTDALFALVRLGVLDIETNEDLASAV